MAIVKCIPEKKQTPSAQKGVINYCMQPSKTLDEDEQLAYVSGYNCVPEMANESFLATPKVFGHEPDGVRFYHYVQSFKVGEDINRGKRTRSEWSLPEALETVRCWSPRI
ncbi:MAG: relaxase/mobilization nuclease domain-containing protein [Clostridia bacterium]|nr:relaxase/mobilization nuclease domain-containing protein [Clostridia bacterium]